MCRWSLKAGWATGRGLGYIGFSCSYLWQGISLLLIQCCFHVSISYFISCLNSLWTWTGRYETSCQHLSHWFCRKWTRGRRNTPPENIITLHCRFCNLLSISSTTFQSPLEIQRSGTEQLVLLSICDLCGWIQQKVNPYLFSIFHFIWHILLHSILIEFIHCCLENVVFSNSVHHVDPTITLKVGHRFSTQLHQLKLLLKVHKV